MDQAPSHRLHPVSAVRPDPVEDPDATAAMPDVRILHDLHDDSWRLSPQDCDHTCRFVDASATLLSAVDAFTQRNGLRLDHLALLTAGVQQLAGHDPAAADQLRDQLARMFAAADQLRVSGESLPDVLRRGQTPPPAHQGGDRAS